MKLFFDQNVLDRILKKVENVFPNSIHPSTVGLNGKADEEIGKYCQLPNFTFVTFDADFSSLANLFSHPPKIIWIRTGNLSTINIPKIKYEYANDIRAFVTSSDYERIACIEIESFQTLNNPSLQPLYESYFSFACGPCTTSISYIILTAYFILQRL